MIDVDAILDQQERGSAVVEARAERAKQQQQAQLDAELARLAKLSRIEYDRERAAAAKRLQIRATTLDAEVEKLRRGEAAGGPAQGRALDLRTPQPWPTPVAGAELLDELAAAIQTYVVLPPGADAAIALWIVFSYALDCFEFAPRLAIHSAVMRSGKT